MEFNENTRGGAALPFIFVVFGQLTDDFVSIGKYANCFDIDRDIYDLNDKGFCKKLVLLVPYAPYGVPYGPKV